MRLTSSEKVNWSSFNFIATFRKCFDPLNPPFGHKSLPKSEKMHFLKLGLAKIYSRDTNPSKKRGHREGQPWGQAIILS